MNKKYQRILAGMERIEDESGRVRIDDLAEATGIANRDINNALRYLRPDFIQVAGRAPRGPCDGGGDSPKVLRLTPDGREIGEEHSVPMTGDQISEMWDAINNLRARLAEVEESNAKLVRKNRRLRQYILDEEL